MTASGRKRPLKTAVLERFERPLSGKADIPLLFCSAVTNTLMTLFTETIFAPRRAPRWDPIWMLKTALVTNLSHGVLKTRQIQAIPNYGDR